MPFVHSRKSRQEANKPSLQTHSKHRQCFPILRNYTRACWQLPALKMITVVTPARDLYLIVHQLLPPQGRLAAKSHFEHGPALKTSPVQLAPHCGEQECCQSCLAAVTLWPQAGQHDMEGSDFMPATWWTPEVPLEQVDNHVDCSKWQCK